ncbi:winged helix-turn-helix transcriptional regulator [Echinicola vietnamensis]|uniref:Putative transcriptional regulator n=1 Tax=Echinicola vietnamensis (strain DSM 17526 / LMG 23754 / KMM 6221) TaxID=926556 RepID=L0FWZ3_ECHVK|nr:helix-turn-helix domain-containing protein [Echinicola vietnamensis]AGA77165.1 putative transcriptional regulator [Echinicola vietnamensis DSM 17526]
MDKSTIEDQEKVHICSSEFVVAVRDTLNVISGKWKLPIIGSLCYGKKRFKDLENDIPKITPRMLSKELKELELNSIITRTVYDTTPVTVEYELTPSGRKIRELLDAMVKWGLQHRETVMHAEK